MHRSSCPKSGAVLVSKITSRRWCVESLFSDKRQRFVSDASDIQTVSHVLCFSDASETEWMRPRLNRRNHTFCSLDASKLNQMRPDVQQSSHISSDGAKSESGGLAASIEHDGSSDRLRPIREVRLWISEGLTQAVSKYQGI